MTTIPESQITLKLWAKKYRLHPPRGLQKLLIKKMNRGGKDNIDKGIIVR